MLGIFLLWESLGGFCLLGVLVVLLLLHFLRLLVLYLMFGFAFRLGLQLNSLHFLSGGPEHIAGWRAVEILFFHNRVVEAIAEARATGDAGVEGLNEGLRESAGAEELVVLAVPVVAEMAVSHALLSLLAVCLLLLDDYVGILF